MCFQYPCMQLINAIVSTPDDLDFRLHLRNEFMRSGLIDAIEVNEFTTFIYVSFSHRCESLNRGQDLENSEHELLRTQVTVFLNHKDEDAEELSHRYDNIRFVLECVT